MLTRVASTNNLPLKWVKNTITRNETFLLVIFSETEVSTENVNIDQQIYFLTKSYDIFEKYKINGHLVRRKLGRFLNNDYQGESRNILITQEGARHCRKPLGRSVSQPFRKQDPSNLYYCKVVPI